MLRLAELTRKRREHQKNVMKLLKVLAGLNFLGFIYQMYLLYKNTPPELKLKQFRRKYISCMLYLNEAYMLYAQLVKMSPHVDIFLIAYADTTFSLIPTNITFYPFEKEIAQYESQIRWIRVNFSGMGTDNDTRSRFKREGHQRDMMMKEIESLGLNEGDILIMSDCDEILTDEGIKYIKKNPPDDYYRVKGAFFYYTLYWHLHNQWLGAAVINYRKDMKNIEYYRKRTKPKIGIKKKLLSIHCSYCFPTMEQVITKLHSFSHAEYSHPPYTNPEYIYGKSICGQSLFRDYEVFRPYDIKKYHVDEIIPNNDSRYDFLYRKSGYNDLSKYIKNVSDVQKFC